MTCTHEKVNILAQSSYCPDCGLLIQNKWYLCRCACCGITRKTTLLFNNVIPQEKYCTNCGSKEFVIEEVKDINFVDIHFAVLKKEAVRQGFEINFAPIQAWVVSNYCNCQRLLIGVNH